MMPWFVAGDEDDEEEKKKQGTRRRKKRHKCEKCFPKSNSKFLSFFKNFALRLGAIACPFGSWQFGRSAISTGSDSLPQQVAAQLVSQTAMGQPQYTQCSTDALLAADWCHCGTGNVKIDSR